MRVTAWNTSARQSPSDSSPRYGCAEYAIESSDLPVDPAHSFTFVPIAPAPNGSVTLVRIHQVARLFRSTGGRPKLKFAAVRVPPTQLHLLLLVLRHNGYSEAERKSGIARATLHRGVKSLEKLFACQFFEPETSKPTRHGRLFRPQLEDIDQRIDALFDCAAAARQPRLCIGSAELVTTEYLPGVMGDFEQRHPDVQCETVSGPEERLVNMLKEGEIDCAVAVDSPAWHGLSRALLATLPLALLVPAATGPMSAAELWAKSPVPFRLVVSSAASALAENFEEGLHGLGVKWPRRRVVSSLAAAVKSVLATGDIALGVAHPALVVPPGIRVLPLTKFPGVKVSAYWVNRKTHEMATLVQLLQAIQAKR